MEKTNQAAPLSVEDIKLTDEEVSILLEPIENHGHCWGAIASAMIKSEKERRFRLMNTQG